MSAAAVIYYLTPHNRIRRLRINWPQFVTTYGRYGSWTRAGIYAVIPILLVVAVALPMPIAFRIDAVVFAAACAAHLWISAIRYEPLPNPDPDKRATQEDIDLLYEVARDHGSRGETLVTRELHRVRALHGEYGLRWGHLWWIHQRLDGQIGPDAVPPSYSPKVYHGAATEARH